MIQLFFYSNLIILINPSLPTFQGLNTLAFSELLSHGPASLVLLFPSAQSNKKHLINTLENFSNHSLKKTIKKSEILRKRKLPPLRAVSSQICAHSRTITVWNESDHWLKLIHGREGISQFQFQQSHRSFCRLSTRSHRRFRPLSQRGQRSILYGEL